MALGGSFALAAKTGADFEDEMVRAFTILKEGGNAVGDSLSRMTSTALGLGRETLFSAIQAAQGMQILARAGFDTKEILSSIRPALNLAIVGNMELAESTNIVISALRGFNMETRDAGKVADILALGSSKANTTIQELGNAFSYVAPVANGAGMAIETTVAAIGILSNAGIKGSKAGTTLRRAISQLLAPSGRATKVMNELGVSFTTSEGKLKPFVSIIRELKTAGMNASQAMQMFGLRAGPGMIALVNAGSGAIGDLSNSLENAQGTAESMSQAFRTTVKGRVRDLMASIVDLGLAFSEKFKKPVADAIFAFRNFIVNIVNAGNRMGVFKAIVKGVKNSLEPVTNLINSLASSFKKWVAQLTPRKVAKFFSDIREDIDGFVKSLTGGEIGATLKDTFKILVGLGGALLGTIKGISKAWMALPEGARNFLRPMVLTTALVLKLFGGLLNIIFLFVSLSALAGSVGIKVALWGAVFVGIKAVLLVILGIIASIAAGISLFKIGKLTIESGLLKNIWELIKSNIEFIVDLVKNIGKGIMEWDFSNIIPSIDAVKEKFDAVTESIKKVWEELTKVPSWFINFLSRGGALGAAVSTMLGGNKQSESKGISGITGSGSITMGGKSYSVAGEAAKDELAALRSMIGQTENMTGTIGYAAKVGALISLQERINELEKIVMEQESNLSALNRINIKPEADRKNKSRIGAGLDG